MSSELQNNRCNACDAEKTRGITFPSGHQARESLQCGLVWSGVDQTFEQLYNFTYKKNDKNFVCHLYLKNYECLKSGGHVKLHWFEKEFLNRKYRPCQGKLLIDWAFDKFGLHKVTAPSLAENIASIITMKKLGFKIEGIFWEEKFLHGNRVDMIRLGLLHNGFRPANKT